MNNAFDQLGINEMTVAIGHEMTPDAGRRHALADTLFIGGTLPSAAGQNDLANFGLSKNWKVIFPSFDPAAPKAGPVGFHAVITDGLTQSIVLQDGRLWKRDRRSPAILLFPSTGAKLRINAKGRLVVSKMAEWYPELGYDFALQAVLARAARKPGNIPVVSTIGGIMAVIDMQSMQSMFAAAA